MKLERTTKKNNRTSTIAEKIDSTVWKGVLTLTAETDVEYFQVRITADEARALADQLYALVGSK